MYKLTCYTSVFVMSVLLNSGLCQAEEKTITNIKPSNAVQFSFDKTPAGQLPAGVHTFTGMWSVRAEQGAPSRLNVVCQSGIADYPALVLGDRAYSDVEISTSFKTISGTEDQAAGIIFRVQDKDNYYILRANALEDNVILFKYVKGRRSSIKEGNSRVTKGIWHELRVDVKGAVIRGYLNNKLVVEATDHTFKTGKVGLWTKADSQTCFDNVSVVAHSR